VRYQASITVPAGTLRSEPATQVVPVTFGYIEQCEVLFPPGQSGLVNVQVWYHERQIFPTSPGESFIGDDHLIIFPEKYPVFEAPFEVVLVGWSPGAVLEHTVYVALTVEAPLGGWVVESVPVPLPE